MTEEIAFPVALAAKVAEWFPELEGRAFAVADTVISPANKPTTFPLAIVCFLRDKPQHAPPTRVLNLDEKVTLEFWFPPTRVKFKNGAESPFFAFYDYTGIRRRLLTRLTDWISPQGQKVRYDSLEVEALEWGVSMVFTLSQSWRFCPDPDDTAGPFPLDVCFSLETRAGTDCPAEPEEESKCP